MPAESWDSIVTGAERAQVTMPSPALWFRLTALADALTAKTPAAGTPVAEATVAESGQAASDAPPTGGPVVPKRIGETVLLVMLALGEQGPRGADPVLMRQALITLRAAGFEKEARAMAVEAALAAGL